MFKSVLDISFNYKNMTMKFYNQTECAQTTEHRTLDSIRLSLLDPNCTGSEIVYGINMDVYLAGDKQNLQQRNQLYGVVMYNSGTLGQEAVRSQGHLHAIVLFLEQEQVRFIKYGMERHIFVCKKKIQIKVLTFTLY